MNEDRYINARTLMQDLAFALDWQTLERVRMIIDAQKAVDVLARDNGAEPLLEGHTSAWHEHHADGHGEFHAKKIWIGLAPSVAGSSVSFTAATGGGIFSKRVPIAPAAGRKSTGRSPAMRKNAAMRSGRPESARNGNVKTGASSIICMSIYGRSICGGEVARSGG